MTKELETTYQALNKKFFGGELPKLKVQWSGMRGALGFLEWKATKPPTLLRIGLSKKTKWSNQIWLISLLHEMIHVKLRNKLSPTEEQHGKPFQKELRRLMRLGAFDSLL